MTDPEQLTEFERAMGVRVIASDAVPAGGAAIPVTVGDSVELMQLAPASPAFTPEDVRRMVADLFRRYPADRAALFSPRANAEAMYNTLEQWRPASCPVCDARGGHPCRTRRGHARHDHRGRVRRTITYKPHTAWGGHHTHATAWGAD